MTWVQGLTVVDIAIIAFLLIALAVGWGRGLAEVLTGFIVFVVTTIVAGRYADDLVVFLNRAWGAQAKLERVLEQKIHFPGDAYKVPLGQIPGTIAVEWLREVPIPDAYKQTLAQRLSDWSPTAGTDTAAQYIIQQLAAGVLNAAAFLILSIGLGWVLTLLGRLVSDQIKEIPVVGTLNRLLGALAICFEVTVVLALIVGLVAPAMSMYGLESLGGAVEHAALAPYFLKVYEWLRGTLFGMSGSSFFV